MGKLAEYLESYFKNTPKEKLEADWKELECLDDVGPTVEEVLMAQPHGPEVMFKHYLKHWEDETLFDSTDLFENENFKAIVAMGEKAVPFILQEIAVRPTQLVHALDLIYPGTVEYDGFVPLEKACEMWTGTIKVKETNDKEV
ncbi:MAG: hypothetical protein LUD72_06405 [Bacteroidales bacterium]|nr:hypothetical protein [Bacteroidales bacterium]